MGGGASKAPTVKIEIDDYEVVVVAGDNNVDLLTKKCLKTSFPQAIGVTLTTDMMLAAEDSWLKIFDDKMDHFKKAMKAKNPNRANITALELFVQK